MLSAVKRAFIGVVLITLVISAACGGNQPGQKPNAAAETAPTKATSTPAGASVNGTGPSGTMVLLEPLFEHAFPPAAGPTYMDQTGLEFLPAVLTAQPG